MVKTRRPFGGKAAKYRCFLNPYTWTRCSKCPRCSKLTYPRKFPLVIGIVGTTAPIILGLTCKYCSKCELIIAHKDVIEPYLVEVFGQSQPEVIGNDYFVAATLELALWNVIKDDPRPLPELLPEMADIKEHLFFECRLV